MDIHIPTGTNSIAAHSRKVLRNEWRPNPKQEVFLSLPYTIKEGLFGGGAGSGKSDLLLLYGIVHRFHENARFKQVFLRRTMPELRNEVLGRSREIYPKFGATLNKTEMVWTFPKEDQIGSGMPNSGAQIFLGHCEYDDDVHQYDSMEISLFTPDEITSLTEFIYLYICQERNRAPKDAGLPSITRAAGMPGGVGHTFVYKRFIKPFKAGGKKIIGKGGNKRIYIHATLADNEEHIDPTYSQSLEGRPEAEKKAKKYGDWEAYQGQVFDEFRDRKYPDEPDNALHVIEPFAIPDWWPKFVIGDWGYAALNHIGFYAVSPSKRLYMYRELYWLKTKIEEWGPILKDYIDRDHPRKVKFCKSAGQERGQEHTIQTQIEEAIGQTIDLTLNSPGSRVAGKMLLHEYLRWKPRPLIPQNEVPEFNDEYARWLLRNKGLEDYKLYLKIFDPPEIEDNIPRLQIFRCSEKETNHEGHPNCCPLVIEAIKAANYDKPKKDKPAEDVAEWDGDDPYDNIRYACDEAETYFEEAKDEFARVQKQAEIIARLQTSGDWTAFYRNQFKLESDEDSNFKAVRRYGRR